MILKKIVKILAIIIAAVIVFAGGLLVFMTATEYKPADVEPLNVKGAAEESYSLGDQLTIMSWNIGYGALGDNADFFMDGGEMVKSASEERVQENMDGIMSTIETIEPDMLIVCGKHKYSSKAEKILGSPDMVMEVVSPSSRGKDRVLKLNKYLENGVREYWIVDPEFQEILVYHFENTAKLMHYSFSDVIPLNIYDGKISVDFGEILAYMKEELGFDSVSF
jgi:hypothetical protein